MDWRFQAACLGVDPELFFPVGTTGPALTSVEQARRICHDCPVQVPCLEWALHHGADHGVWGGLDEQQRAIVRRHRRTGMNRTPAATAPVLAPTTRSRAVSRGDAFRRSR